MVIGVAAALVSATAARASAQFEQGSTRNLSGISASITLTDGVPGFISASTMRPFVTGLVPVVGDYGGAFAPVYGPAALVPQYNPGPSVIRHRLARMRQEGISLVPRRADVRRNASTSSASGQKPGDLQSRFATARESSAGRAVESIAAIRNRQARERVVREREIVELRRKMELAHTAGKPELARIYHQQIERTGGNLGTLSGSQGRTR
jgi:hypothetical protein